jgi:putative PIN family toxin of toxin-antitoxin system
MIRAVMDTNVLVSAFRSKRGASFELFRLLRLGKWNAVLSNHLFFEYEEVLKRTAPELGLSAEDADELLNAVCARSEQWTLPHGWQPVLADPDDEPMVQLAYESGALLIVSHNVADLFAAAKLGIEILKPSDFLARVRAL